MTTLKGIFPDIKTVKGKNFIHENIKNLRRVEYFNMSKELDEIQKSQVYNGRKVTNNSNNSHNYNTNVLSKLNSNFQGKKHDANNVNATADNKVKQPQELCKKCSVPMLNKNNVTRKVVHLGNNSLLNKQRKKDHRGSRKSSQKLYEKVPSDPNLSYKSVNDIVNNDKIKVRSQGIQTLETEDIDNLYFEGVIKYPTKKYHNSSEAMDKNETNEEVNVAPRNIANQPSDRGDVQSPMERLQNKNSIKDGKLCSSKEETDFIKLNKERISSVNKIAPQVNTNVSSSNYRMGVIPKYIKNRKEMQEKVQKAKAEEIDRNCPIGHVPLADSERKETLRMLRKNYQDYVNELNMMPIKVDTLRAQRRKIEIEKQLNKLEEGIKVFSRPKVYVKMNA